MDDYWMKSGNKEMANKKLDDDMDAYWEKKGEVTTEGAGEADAKVEAAEGAEEAKE